MGAESPTDSCELEHLRRYICFKSGCHREQQSLLLSSGFTDIFFQMQTEMFALSQYFLPLLTDCRMLSSKVLYQHHTFYAKSRVCYTKLNAFLCIMQREYYLFAFEASVRALFQA